MLLHLVGFLLTLNQNTFKECNYLSHLIGDAINNAVQIKNYLTPIPPYTLTLLIRAGFLLQNSHKNQQVKS